MMDFHENLRAYSQENLRACQLKQLSILQEIDKICKRHHLNYWLDGGTLLGAVRHGGFIPWDDDIDIAMGYDDMLKFEEIAARELPAHLAIQSPRNDPSSKEPIVKVRDLNSLYIEHGDNFESDYLKGIYVDIFPFTKHPGISKSMIKKLAKGISKSNSILHHLHRYSLRSFAEFFWFGAQYYLYTGLWNLACCLVKSKRYANIPIINGYGITHERDQVLPVSVIKFEGLEFSAPHNPDQYLKNIYRNYMEIPPVEKRKFHSVYIQPELVKKD